MDAEELDIWYDEEKTKIFEKYVSEKDKDPKSEERYKQEMIKLRNTYNKRFDKTLQTPISTKVIDKIKSTVSKLKPKK